MSNGLSVIRCTVFCAVIAFVGYLILYMEMYRGMDIFHTQILTLINNDIDNKLQTTITHHINHKSNISHLPYKLLIGIGSTKSGSTYFQALLQKAVTYLPSTHLRHFQYLISGETHFFTECSSICSFDEYLKTLINSNQINTTKSLILSEKTPIYFHNQIASTLLTFYSNLYGNIYFFCITAESNSSILEQYVDDYKGKLH